MATLTIRNLPDEVRNRLRMAAAERGRSMEAEARAVLTERFGWASGPEFDAEAVTQEVQAAFAPYRAQRGSAVDELIAERRIEVWKGTLEALRDLRRGRGQDQTRCSGEPGSSR